MSADAQPAEKTVAELLALLVEGQKLLVEEIRGLRSDMEARTGPLGDPIIRMDSKKWGGPSFKGKRASECPWEFLEIYAGLLQFKLDNPRDEDDQKYAKSNAREVALVLRWMMINRGKVPPPAPLPPKKAFARPAERAPDALPPAQGDVEAAPPPAKTTTWSSGKSGWGKAPAA